MRIGIELNGVLRDTLRKIQQEYEKWYIENSFNPTGDEVPAGIEDWCYQQLESHFGGWEINEGSDGAFVFNFNNSTVTLDHVYNTEENQTDTLYEESFAK